eukprot:1644809-Amphidinium_carterae.1
MRIRARKALGKGANDAANLRRSRGSSSCRWLVEDASVGGFGRPDRSAWNTSGMQYLWHLLAEQGAHSTAAAPWTSS